MTPALALQVTAWLLVLLTVAVNCWLPLEDTVALVGEIAMLTGATVPLLLMVSAALASTPGSATLVAVTVTWIVAVTVGAVNRPLGEIVPALADQRTDWLLASLTVAVNCWVPFEVSVALRGEIDTATVAVAGGDLAPAVENPHEMLNAVIARRTARQHFCTRAAPAVTLPDTVEILTRTGPSVMGK